MVIISETAAVDSYEGKQRGEQEELGSRGFQPGLMGTYIASMGAVAGWSFGTRSQRIFARCQFNLFYYNSHQIGTFYSSNSNIN